MKYLIWLLVFSLGCQAQEIKIDALQFKNIGPTIMSGRVVDLAVNPDNPTEFYVAYASGGLWYTNNNGSSFDPVMDTAPTLNCGSVTVNWKTGEIWVGTGEVNSSRSSYAGIGLLKSSDKGKTWQNLGLEDSHHISRVWVNPTDSNEIIVAALGHLYTKNEERGIFKTVDGGKTWRKTLFVSNTTGIIDLQVAIANPKIMYAASWQKDRKAWNFSGNGKESGIYKSLDGGDSWSLISLENSGFPQNEGVGRIGLAVVSDDVIYAVLDNQNMRPNAKKEKPQDANAALFETEVIGCELYKSVDAGKSWSKTHQDFIDDMYYSYGYYFANIAVNPIDENQIYIGGVPLLISEDGGKSFKMISKENVHADHHVTWVNPKNSNHIINGNDGGVNITYDKGKNWLKCNNEAVGQFYAIQVDNEKPYNVYGGLQDNGVWVASSNYEKSKAWQQYGKYPYQEIMGGDGMQIQIDSRDVNLVYTGFQYGNYYRLNRKTHEMKSITPKRGKNSKEPAYRFNWQTPILLSSHNQDIVYIGSQFLHRSLDKGETWQEISPDLSSGKKDGNVAFATLTTIAESKLKFGLLYAGTDDGNLYMSKNGGDSWTTISANLPPNLWVSRVVASTHKEGGVYVTLNGYRNDDFKAYVYKSEDFGSTWKLIVKGVKDAPVNVIYEDDNVENVLYLGTDNSLFVSWNQGENWVDFSQDLPYVAVHDIKLQTRDRELVVGTHGRSIYKVNISALEKLSTLLKEEKDYIFDIEKIKWSKTWGTKSYAWEDDEAPMVEIWIYAVSEKTDVLQVLNSDKKVVYEKELNLKKGLNKVVYSLESQKHFKKTKAVEEKKSFLNIGEYTVGLKNSKSNLSKLEIVDESKKN